MTDKMHDGRRATKGGAKKPTLKAAADEREREGLPPEERPDKTAARDVDLGELEEAASLGSVPELLEFVREYPDVTTLPDEVLEAVRGGKPLMRAYAEYENARLRDELAAHNQNRRNAERTPGSVGSSAGESSEIDELLAVFDSVFK